MGSHEKPVDRGARLGRAAIGAIARELREGRVDRGLSLRQVSLAVGMSESEASRIERGLIPGVSLIDLSRLASVVGLELSIRTYAGGQPLRDQAHAALLNDLRRQLHRSLAWATEVPLPIPGDARGWDGFISATGWRYGVEAETAPRDGQALARRLQLKLRDGYVDGVILLLRNTRQTREFLGAAAGLLEADLPIAGGRALELLRAGVNPGGSSIVVLPQRPRSKGGAA